MCAFVRTKVYRVKDSGYRGDFVQPRAIVAWRCWIRAGPLGSCSVFSVGWPEATAGDPVDHGRSARRKSTGRTIPIPRKAFCAVGPARSPMALRHRHGPARLYNTGIARWYTGTRYTFVRSDLLATGNGAAVPRQRGKGIPKASRRGPNGNWRPSTPLRT
jgi:hypothetical protein